MKMQAFAIKLTTALVLLLGVVGTVQATSVDDGFNPDADNDIFTIVQQRNGQLLLGGMFTNIGGKTRNLVARLNNDGSTDSFNPDISGAFGMVLSLDEQPDGSILIGGYFSTVSGQTRNNIARVNSAGTLDPGFNPDPDGVVNAVVSLRDPDGLSNVIYVAGEFNTVGGMSRHNIARLHADGSVDTSFVPPAFTGAFYSVKIQPDGRILVAGTSSQIDGVGTHKSMIRLNIDGSLDPSFNPTMTNYSIQDLAVQPDGKILIAGVFTSVAGQTRHSIARLHVNGQLDAGFVPPTFNANIRSMVLQSDGRVTVGGLFDNDSAHQKVARLQADGSIDTSFNTVVGSGIVYALVHQADGNYAIGGAFTQVDTVARNNIARLDASGAVDVDFVADLSSGPDDRVNVLAVQTDGKVLVGGKKVGESIRTTHSPDNWPLAGRSTSSKSALTRLLGNGLPDPAFECSIVGDVGSLIAYPNGSILVAGQFNDIGQNVVRLLNDGTVDNTFTATANARVSATARQRNGKILLGGAFTDVGGLERNNLARLFSNGTVDPGFNPTVNGQVVVISIQPDGKILIGGLFTTVNGESTPNLARLNADGSLDSTFQADVDAVVGAIAIDASGSILIGGSFANVDGTGRVGIARLEANGSLDSTFIPHAYGSGTTVLTIVPMTNGRILIGGYSPAGGSSKAFVHRLSSNGSQNSGLDPTFLFETSVASLFVQPDGKLLVGGTFHDVDGKARKYVARIAQVGSAFESLYVENGSELRWERKGTGPELINAPQVMWSSSCCDSSNFQLLPNSTMSRNGDVWELDGISTVGQDAVWLRAVSLANDGGRGMGAIESQIIQFQPSDSDDHIFADGFE